MHNIAYGRPNATQEQVIQAAKQAVRNELLQCEPRPSFPHFSWFTRLTSFLWRVFINDALLLPQRLHDAVLRMPDGYLTMVGERGLKVHILFGNPVCSVVVLEELQMAM